MLNARYCKNIYYNEFFHILKGCVGRRKNKEIEEGHGENYNFGSMIGLYLIYCTLLELRRGS